MDSYMRNHIAFIGVGNMGSAILSGVLSSGVFAPDHVILCDVSQEKCAPFFLRGCQYTASPKDAAQRADCLLLAVKPQQIDSLLTEISTETDGKLVISIAAGVTIARIRNLLPHAAVVRVMPNTPLQVGEGVSALCPAKNVSEDDYSLALRIFSASGMAFETKEELINPITALTSSSIAYFARFIGDMCAWASQNGFPDDENTLEMVCRSAIGTAQLLMKTTHTPASLERAVTSPNGTTERAMAVFNEAQLGKIVADAMDACRRRADELSGN